MPFSALTLTSGKLAVGSEFASNREQGAVSQPAKSFESTPSNEQIDPFQFSAAKVAVELKQ